jgi:hypothetical protein
MDAVDWTAVSVLAALMFGALGYIVRQLNRVEQRLSLRMDRMDDRLNDRMDRMEDRFSARFDRLEEQYIRHLEAHATH